MKTSNFDFLAEYKYYGRRKSLLYEDELDDALGLSPEDIEKAAGDQEQTDNVEPATDTSMENDTSSDVQPETGGSKVELDVTQLVLKQDEISRSVQDILNKLSDLVKNDENLKSDLNKKISDLESSTINNINNVKTELQKRTPTPIEKLQLQSLHSFPYNIKLTDYWKPTEEDRYKYAVANVKTNMNDDPTFNVNIKNLPNIDKKQETDNEYILKQSEIMKDYNETFVKKSF